VKARAAGFDPERSVVGHEDQFLEFRKKELTPDLLVDPGVLQAAGVSRAVGPVSVPRLLDLKTITWSTASKLYGMCKKRAVDAREAKVPKVYEAQARAIDALFDVGRRKKRPEHPKTHHTPAPIHHNQSTKYLYRPLEPEHLRQEGVRQRPHVGALLVVRGAAVAALGVLPI